MEKIKKEQNLKKLKIIILVLCLILFMILLKNVINEVNMKTDEIGYNLISKYLISNSITPFVKIITSLSSTGFIILITIILAIIIKNKKIALSVVLNPILAITINTTLKHIIQRPRPIEYRIINETGYSFPSGHSMMSMAFYGFLIYLIYHYVKNKKTKVILITVLSILILLIGTSRIYLGVHYTSDVLAGFLLSLSYLVIYTTFTKKFIIEREDKNEIEN